jgi:stress-induced morphogen
MIAADEVIALIQAELQDAKVDILDKTGMSDHFIIRVVSKQFDGVNPLDRHRRVMGCLETVMREGRLHAAEIQTAVL